jgi:hypothetical protein
MKNQTALKLMISCTGRKKLISQSVGLWEISFFLFLLFNITSIALVFRSHTED